MNVKLTKNQIIDAYRKNKCVVKVNNVSSTGYYFIVDITEIKEENRVKSVKVKALYHPTESDFENSPIFDVQLASLFNNKSEGMKEIAREELFGAIINITSLNIEATEYKGQAGTTNKVIWDIIEMRDIIEYKPSYLNGDSPFATDMVGEDDLGDEYEEELCQLLYDEQARQELIADQENEILQLVYDQFAKSQFNDELLQLLYDEQILAAYQNEVDSQLEEDLLFDEYAISEAGYEAIASEVTQEEDN